MLKLLRNSIESVTRLCSQLATSLMGHKLTFIKTFPSCYNKVAGVAGLEPTHARVKVWCLTDLAIPL